MASGQPKIANFFKKEPIVDSDEAKTKTKGVKRKAPDEANKPNKKRKIVEDDEWMGDPSASSEGSWMEDAVGENDSMELDTPTPMPKKASVNVDQVPDANMSMTERLQRLMEVDDPVRHAEYIRIIHTHGDAWVEGTRRVAMALQEEVSDDDEPDAKPTKAKKTGSGPTYTPLEKQYIAAKKQYRDCIIFVEAGYRYRFFGEDAEVCCYKLVDILTQQIAAKVLDIRAHVSHNFLSASIPTFRLHFHARRMVQAGYKVGVLSQTETAALKALSKNKSGPFERKLTAIYTKGTLQDELDPLTSDELSIGHYLLCIYETPAKKDQIKINIVAIKTSTGEIIYDVFTDDFLRNELETRLIHIQPVEIILQTSVSMETKKIVDAYNFDREDTARVEVLDDSRFDTKNAKILVEDHLILNSDNRDKSKEEAIVLQEESLLVCLSGLISYLTDFGLASLFNLSSNFTHFASRSMFMDSRTLVNLDLFPASQVGKKQKGKLFSLLDYTSTPMGKRMLFLWMKKPLLDIEAIRERQNAVEWLIQTNSKELERFFKVMKEMPDLERALCRIYYQKCTIPEFLLMLHGLRLLVDNRPLNLFDLPENNKYVNGLFTAFPADFEKRVSEIERTINPKATTVNDPNLFTDLTQFPGIADAKEAIKQCEDKLDIYLREIRQLLKMPQLTYVTKAKDEYLIEIPIKNIGVVPSEWNPFKSTKTCKRYRPANIEAQLLKLQAARETLANETREAWTQYLKEFSTQYDTYRQLVTTIATLDALHSLSVFSNNSGYVKPTMVAEKTLHIKNGRHPIVESLLNTPFVPNDTEFGKLQSMILTGPNMGGKTCYTRQVAIICLLAQMGSYVPAEEATLSPLDAIYTRMGANDNPIKGQSTFLLELQETSDILQRATDRSLVILDELGRGTSTHDGFAIAYATLHHIVSKVECFTIFVTHYPSLSRLSEVFPGQVANYHIACLKNEASQDELRSEDIVFLYKLEPGVEKRSYGMNVARLADLPAQTVALAMEKSIKMENETKSRMQQAGVRQVWQLTEGPFDKMRIKKVQDTVRLIGV